MGDPNDMVDLDIFPDEATGALVVALLAKEGIPAACIGGHIKNSGLYFALCVPIKVVVRRADLARARELIEQDAPPEGWEDEAEESPAEDE